MENKVVPINFSSGRFEAFNVYSGILEDTDVIEERRVGIAFLRGGSNVFSMRLWMFPAQKYFVAPVNDDQEKYEILTFEEYNTRDGEAKSQWHRVGKAEYFGNYLKLKFHLLERDIFLSLFPNRKEPFNATG